MLSGSGQEKKKGGKPECASPSMEPHSDWPSQPQWGWGATACVLEKEGEGGREGTKAQASKPGLATPGLP